MSNQPGASWPMLTADEAVKVAANIGLVHMFLRRWRIPPDVYEDRVQDATLGLCRAVQRFDPTRGCAFSTYAQSWIRQGVMRGREVEEGVNARRAYEAGETYLPPLSLDAPIGDDGDDFASVTPSPADTEASALAAVSLYDTLAVCRDDLDRAAVVGAVIGLPDVEVARQFGVTNSSVAGRRRQVSRFVQSGLPRCLDCGGPFHPPVHRGPTPTRCGECAA